MPALLVSRPASCLVNPSPARKIQRLQALRLDALHKCLNPMTQSSVPDLLSETEDLVVRFAGDSGDGVQVVGQQYTLETALAGNDLATFPDFPAEIRAPAGTLFGVSAYQIHFGSRDIRTAGDDLDVLVAFNPAALKTNVGDLKPGGLLVIDTGAFNERSLKKADYDFDPLIDNRLDQWRVLAVDITAMTRAAVVDCGVSTREAARSKNFFALGLVLWLTSRHRETTREWMQGKFASSPAVLAANLAALDAGHAWGETAELPPEVGAVHVAPASLAEGTYRNINGTEALSFGLLTGARLAELELVYCSYPITPASNMLHALTQLAQYGVQTFQAEDEIAAACAALGASYGGSLGATGSSGPGLALKMETIGLAIGAELPMVIVNAQRGGPSTGLPTKTEQSDLFQAVLGRNADAPVAVVASRSAGDCFETAVEAVRLAVTYMTPVILLTDGYLANASEPWLIPDPRKLDSFKVAFHSDPEGFEPFSRDETTLARPWVKPGTPGLAHRIGGIERADGSGNISYDPDNHQLMTQLRRNKIDGIANDIPAQGYEFGDESDSTLIVGWGSTWGPIQSAVQQLRSTGMRVASTHLRHLWPLPANLGSMLEQFDRVIVPEMNDGQLVKLLRAQYAIDATGINKVAGQPFRIRELVESINKEVTT